MLQRVAILQLILYIAIKVGGVTGDLKSIGDKLGMQEKAKRGNLWDWIKTRTNRHILFFYIG